MTNELKDSLTNIYNFLMITKILIMDIVKFLDADYLQIKTAIEQCRTKGILTKHEMLQLANQGLPIIPILRTMLKVSMLNELESALDNREVTFEDLLCIIGIIAQDFKIRYK